MLFAVVQNGPDVHERVTRQDALLHRFLDPLLDRRSVAVGDHAADNFVEELEAAAPGQGLQLDPTDAVLAVTTRLANVATLCLRAALQRLPVWHTRLAQRDVDAELALHALAR